jgi:hypothetical protein
MTNIEKFEQCSAELLAQLYQSFPVKMHISIRDYAHYDNEDNSGLFFATIEFLNDEKFIRYDSDIYGGYMGVILTSKGLAILNSTQPEIIDDKETIGHKITHAVNENSNDLIKTLINTLLKT